VSRSFRKCAALGLLALFSSSGFAKETSRSAAPTELKITVRVYNYVKMGSQALAAAEREATEILRRAGIEVEWLDLSDCREGGRTEPPCHSPLGPAELILRILARPPDEYQHRAGETFGVALVPLNGSDGVDAAVFLTGVQDFSRISAASSAQILGHLVAHEIGHLLLGLGAHSSIGIMRPGWTAEELDRAARGQLGFTPQQSEKMRAAVARRLAQPRAIGESASPGSVEQPQARNPNAEN